MVNMFQGADRAGLVKFGSLVALPLIAATLAPSADAQVRGPRPVVASPPTDGAVLRRRLPNPTPTATASDCPDPIEARRVGRAVPAGCPGGEQAPVRQQSREDIGGRRGSGSPVRNYAEDRDTPVATPPGEGRIRRRVPIEDRAADTPRDELPVERRGVRDGRDGPAIRTRTIPTAEDPEVRRIPRDRGGRVVENELPAENSGYEDRGRDSGGITRIAPTPDDPRMRYTPDRGRVVRTPEEEAPPAETRPKPWERRGGDPVATIPDDGPRRTRQVHEPRYSTDRDIPPVTPVRPVRPVGGNLPPIVDDAGQLECVFPNADATVTYIEVIRLMLCGFPGPGKSMPMLFTPEQWQVVSEAYGNMHAVRVTFGAPVNGVYPVLSVTEGRLARTEAVCVPVYAAYSASNTLTVGPKGEAAKPYRMWCTADGKVVRPIDMFWTTGSNFNSLFEATVEDGPINVQYFDISTPNTLIGARQLGLYPQLGTNWTNTTAIADLPKVQKQYAGPGGFGFTYAEPPLTGPVLRCVGSEQEIASGICKGYQRKGEPVWTAYRAFAPAVVRSAAQRPAKYGETKQVYYTLMPGFIPVQHRAEAGGACRVILGVEIEMRGTESRVGTGGGDQRQPSPDDGQSSGVAGTPYVPAAPVADSCQN